MNPSPDTTHNPIMSLHEDERAALLHWSQFDTTTGDMGERGFTEASRLVHTIQKVWRNILHSEYNPGGYLGSAEGHSIFYNHDNSTVFTAALPIAYSSVDSPSIARQLQTGFEQVVQYLLSTDRLLPDHIKIGFMVNHTVGGPAHWVGISADYDCTNPETQARYDALHRSLNGAARLRDYHSPFEREYGEVVDKQLGDIPLADLPPLTGTYVYEGQEYLIDLYDANQALRPFDPESFELCLPHVKMHVSSMDSLAANGGSSYQNVQFEQILKSIPNATFEAKSGVSVQSGLTCMDHACWNAVVHSYLGFVPTVESDLLRFITDASEEDRQAAIKTLLLDQLHQTLPTESPAASPAAQPVVSRAASPATTLATQSSSTVDAPSETLTALRSNVAQMHDALAKRAEKIGLLPLSPKNPPAAPRSALKSSDHLAQRRQAVLDGLSAYQAERHRIGGRQVPSFIWGALVLLLAIVTLGIVRKPLLKFKLEQDVYYDSLHSGSEIGLDLVLIESAQRNQAIETSSSLLACCYGYSATKDRNKLGAFIKAQRDHDTSTATSTSSPVAKKSL